MEIVVTIDERGRIIIPVRVRRKLGVKAGDKFLLRAMDDGVIELIPLSKLYREVAGVFEEKFRGWQEDLHEASRVLNLMVR